MSAHAQEFAVKHVHAKVVPTKGDAPGRLTVSADGVAYRESNLQKKNPHQYTWAWSDIQKLTLNPDRLEIITYKDMKWQLGRDREFAFTGQDFDQAYPLLQPHLTRRLNAEVARTDFEPATRILAKRMQGRSGIQLWSGAEGTLLFGSDRIVFDSGAARGSHTFLLDDIENISTSDPLDLTISSLGQDHRFLLKEPLPPALYRELWRKFNIERTAL